ncbi:hypothetical protein BpOF4_21739 (plasmid) [Alkalihalophilus pseudofirmus OF4]|uniref:Uncharacterized protein n=2 Tax=Bacillaceae TaxID=186817 RepID=D3G1W7_ALKPO|nr:MULTISPECIES: hypothetical protein [Alkalihalophilus]AAA75478.1 orf1; similar to Vibrio parahaemolyticus MotX protein [Cytobacillus firmus]ADC52343.1 hypothetical protein BpOF4_21739 [Alkalihalophilus pseudofirmus OF4]MED1602969.1 hypothetical protein [Alkalihalophilus marmarensis]
MKKFLISSVAASLLVTTVATPIGAISVTPITDQQEELIIHEDQLFVDIDVEAFEKLEDYVTLDGNTLAINESDVPLDNLHIPNDTFSGILDV